MFHTILIANRGEIACRIISTCKQLGIRSVAVFSDVDASALHVQLADEAVNIGEAEPEKSYLNISAIIQAAKATGAQAIHPGYGFLAESEAFALACAESQLVFIGPPASAIAAMGNKSAAKALMEEAGVPLVPGYHGNEQHPDFLSRAAVEIGFPVLIKASSGGGGKGMRIVEDVDTFNDALLSCQREAQSSFGNDHVLLERYLAKPRHIEIQVFADEHGNIVHLHERDCSVQRRHQKVIEEAPAPGISHTQREAMGAAAIAAARAVNYVGAGTVEFICESDGSFYFMEMNTRLQVEHPVTEQITGLDLVEWQLRVAAGFPLPLTQKQIAVNGHAFEARIYAENPDNQFLPSIGMIRQLVFPLHERFTHGEVRVDSGIREGDVISPFYDPMIAKLIVHGPDRDSALAALSNALGQTHIQGLHTNVRFLQRLANDTAFAEADLDTGLIARRESQLFPDTPKLTPEALAIAALTRLAEQGFYSNQHTESWVEDPWDNTDGWRLSGRWKQQLQFSAGDQSYPVTLHHQDGRWQCEDRPLQWQTHLTTYGYLIHLQLAQHLLNARVYVDHHQYHFELLDKHYELTFDDPVQQSHHHRETETGSLTAPMPGKVLSIAIKAGDVVKSGQILLILEAMKMEHAIQSPHEGRVAELFYSVGDQVDEGAELLALEQTEK
ncbi:acetyl/propionyl/methylcrotonyl-CoA carboxylase subunit alpha [Paenalcaligenes niemegkensis]|uniref:acetyl/propionyl/methylcrotonyl-CoA carboxylase subunit alpha n=1 Tax=Paenalcaligenes niemegkensis TaxID=2895469 RepID=UPI001EE8075C|nr:acetyl/propionyl/methylcrotonyl-CoA carboxylase subunit alpha [Paenalcaligenes niemegkensis]MCQ9617885.1 acetyl/propionyl/methylcrotonyl-CoA carboxylase subunit alpha [Paenalcaligenes niemegkensis]